MAAYTVLYNPYAGNGRGEENTRAIGDFLPGEEIDFHDMTKIEDYGEFFRLLPPETRVILSGGDGTSLHDNINKCRKHRENHIKFLSTSHRI